MSTTLAVELRKKLGSDFSQKHSSIDYQSNAALQSQVLSPQGRPLGTVPHPAARLPEGLGGAAKAGARGNIEVQNQATTEQLEGDVRQTYGASGQNRTLEDQRALLPDVVHSQSSKTGGRLSRDNSGAVSKGKAGNVRLKNSFEHLAGQKQAGRGKARIERIEQLHKDISAKPRRELKNASKISNPSHESFANLEVEQLQHWYNLRKKHPTPFRAIQEEGSLDARHLAQHYHQHLAGNGEPSELFSKFSQMQNVRHPNLSAVHSQLPTLAKEPGGAMINVHQHFNQPTIHNFNHNSFYVNDEKGKPMLSTEFPRGEPHTLSGVLRNAKSHGGPGQQRQRKPVPGQLYTSGAPQRKAPSKPPANGHQATQSWSRRDEQPSLGKRTASQLNTQKKKRLNSNDEVASHPMHPTLHDTIPINEASGDEQEDFLKQLGDTPIKDSAALSKAINAQTRFFNQLSMEKRLALANQQSLMPNGIRIPTQKRKLVGAGKIYSQYSSQQMASQILKFSPTNNPYQILQNGKRRDASQLKKGAPFEIDREDLRDQLLLVKSQLNQANEELLKSRTRQQVLVQQMKEKDRFIDELIRSTLPSGVAMVTLPDGGQAVPGGSLATLESSKSEKTKSLLEGGPYSVLKLRKRVHDLKELLQNKTQENDDLMRNLRHKKVLELQKEVALYARECQRLRAMTKQALRVAKKHGHEAELAGLAEAQDFLASLNLAPSQASLHSNSKQEVQSRQTLLEKTGTRSPGGQSGTLSKDAAREKDGKVTKLERSLQQLQLDRAELMENERKKDERIVSLEQKLKEFKALPKGPVAKQAGRNKGKLGPQQSSPRDGSNGADPGPSVALQTKVNELTDEKAELQKKLKSEKLASQQLQKKVQQLETQRREASKKEAGEADSVVKDLVKAKGDNQKLGQQVEKLQSEVRVLKRQVAQGKGQEQQQPAAQQAVQQMELEKLQKTVTDNKKEMERLKREGASSRQQITEKNGKIAALERQLEEARAAQVHKLEPKSTVAVGRKASQHSKSSLPQSQASRGRSTTTKRPPANAASGQQAPRKPDADNLSERTTSQLEEERNMIQQRIADVRESDFDERSDILFSQMQSQVPGVTTSDINVRSSKRVETIAEDVDAENEQPKNFKFQVAKAPTAGKEKLLSPTKVAKPKLTKNQVSSSEVMPARDRKLTVVEGRVEHHLLQQIDQIPSESKLADDFDSLQADEGPRGSIKVLRFIEIDHPSVQLGFKRLGRLLQICRLQLDQIESVLLEGKFKAHQSISITQLQDILEAKLALARQQAMEMARFLIEERDDDDSEVGTIEFDPKRKINSQYIPVRLMTQFKELPKVYTPQQEEEAKASFTEAFDKPMAKKLVKALNSQEEAIISFELFDAEVRKLDTQRRLGATQIDCAYILLCRGKSDFKKIQEPELAEKIRGFDSQDISLLFEKYELDIDDYSSDEAYSEPQADVPISDEFHEEEIPDDFKETEQIQAEKAKASKPPATEQEPSDENYEEDFVEEEVAEEMANDSTPFAPSTSPPPIQAKTGKFQQEELAGDPKSSGTEGKAEAATGKAAGQADSKGKMKQAELAGTVDQKHRDRSRTEAAPAEFTFKQAKSPGEASQSPGHASRLSGEKPFSHDRSDNEFEQQESLDPSQIDNGKFGSKASREKAQSQAGQTGAEQPEPIMEQTSEHAEEAPEGQPEVAVLDQKAGPAPAEEAKELPVEAQPSAPKAASPAPAGEEAFTLPVEDDYEDADIQPAEVPGDQVEQPLIEQNPVLENNPEQPVEPEGAHPEQPAGAAEGEVLGELQQEVAQRMGAEGLAVLKVEQVEPVGGEEEKQNEVPGEEEKAPEKEELKEEPKEEEKAEQPEEAEVEASDRFTKEQLQNLNQVIGEVLREKMVLEGLQDKITVPHKIQLVTTAAHIFRQVGEIIHENFEELITSCREGFREILYSEVHKRSSEEANADLPLKFEIEVMRPSDFKGKIEELLYPKVLTQGQASCLNIVLQRSNHAGNILYSDVCRIMEALGITDVKTPAGVTASHQLDYESLDLRSVRLINRMIHYLGSEQVSFLDFMKDIVQQQQVKTKSANQTVDIFAAKKFFNKLYAHGIKKNPEIHQNLCTFLCLDKKYKNYLMLKKLKRCIIDFNQSGYFQSIGLKKQKLAPAAADYEYYDEEDDTPAVVQKPVTPPQPARGPPPQVPQQSYQAGMPLTLNEKSPEGEYEYYDEEDDGNTAKPPAKQAQPGAMQLAPEKVVQAPLAEPVQPPLQPPAPVAQAPPVPADEQQYEYYDEEDDATTPQPPPIQQNPAPLDQPAKHAPNQVPLEAPAPLQAAPVAAAKQSTGQIPSMYDPAQLMQAMPAGPARASAGEFAGSQEERPSAPISNQQIMNLINHYSSGHVGDPELVAQSPKQAPPPKSPPKEMPPAPVAQPSIAPQPVQAPVPAQPIPPAPPIKPVEKSSLEDEGITYPMPSQPAEGAPVPAPQPAPEEQYEYYDEEDDATQTQQPTPLPGPPVPVNKSINSEVKAATQPPPAAPVGPSLAKPKATNLNSTQPTAGQTNLPPSQPPGQKQEYGEEYEYYDEEAD